MLSLKSFKFGNIGRFVTDQDIKFTAFGKLVQFNGYNKNTGGSSGAAKSTVFHAVDYNLGINDIPASSLQSRLTKEGMWTESTFDVDGVTLIVKRSKKAGLTLQFGDEIVSGNVKLAEERLQEIIGIPKKLFKKMVHKKQKEGGFFLNLTAKESYEFLMNSLGLEETTKKTVQVDKDISELKVKIRDLFLEIEGLDSSIDEVKKLRDFEKEPVCSVNKEELDITYMAIQKFDTWIERVQKDKDKSLSDVVATKPVEPVVVKTANGESLVLGVELKNLQDEKGQALLDHLNKKEEIQMKADVLKKELSRIPLAQMIVERKAEEMQDLLEEKKHIEEEQCPTCKQKWAGEGATQKVTDITDSLSSIKSEIILNKAIVDTKETVEGFLTRVNGIIFKLDRECKTDEFDKKIDKIKEDMVRIEANRRTAEAQVEGNYFKELNKYHDRIKELTDSYDLTLKPKVEERASLQEEFTRKRQEMENYSHNAEMYNNRIANFTKTLKEKKKNLKATEKLAKETSKKLAVAEETKRLIKTYTLQIFQDTLNYIGSYATEILSEIPNMSNTTIYFEGCKENKSGSIKDEVNAIVNMDGYDNINIKTLSGGERTAIDLAVDLAVIDMIESKAGKGADFFILDEPFDGLEDVNIAQCLEVLKQVDTNKKIIIVDHNPIVKEMITDSVIVERDGEESVVL
jgi:DNA repair exonuclease SbcCD ATPase subunit